jgi:hypothetical protein
MFQKYFTFLYPILACVLVSVILAAPSPARIFALLGAWLAISSASFTLEAVVRSRAIEASLPALLAADRIVLDTPARGVVPVVLWNVPDSTPVFIASQADLLEEPQRWLEPLTARSLWVSDLERAKPDGRARMQALLRERFSVREGRWAVFGERLVYGFQ